MGALPGSVGAPRAQPLGVDISCGTIAVIVFSSASAIAVSVGALWILLLMCSAHIAAVPVISPSIKTPVPKRLGRDFSLKGELLNLLRPCSPRRQAWRRLLQQTVGAEAQPLKSTSILDGSDQISFLFPNPDLSFNSEPAHDHYLSVHPVTTPGIFSEPVSLPTAAKPLPSDALFASSPTVSLAWPSGSKEALYTSVQMNSHPSGPSVSSPAIKPADSPSVSSSLDPQRASSFGHIFPNIRTPYILATNFHGNAPKGSSSVPLKVPSFQFISKTPPVGIPFRTNDFSALSNITTLQKIRSHLLEAIIQTQKLHYWPLSASHSSLFHASHGRGLNSHASNRLLAPASVTAPMEASSDMGPLSGSPLESPSHSHGKFPSIQLPAPAPSSNLPLPAIIPQLPHPHRGSTSTGKPPLKIEPPLASSLPHSSKQVPVSPPSSPKSSSTLSCEEHHHQIPTPIFSPGPAPLASAGGVQKLIGTPFSQCHRHKHPKSPSQTSPDCVAVPCEAPYTQSPLGSPCGCVLPIQVELKLGVALYALFPSISVLAEDIAFGTLLLQSQVRVTGASADSQDQGKSIALINLVPLDQAFDNLTALLIFQRFWNHEVPISRTLFGNYSVIYVNYPGLPPPPQSSDNPRSTTMGGLPGSVGGPHEQPLGVDISKRSDKISGGSIVVIVLSSSIAVAVSLGALWILFLKCHAHIAAVPMSSPSIRMPKPKRLGGGSILSSDLGSSMSASFASTTVTYTTSVRAFSLSELKRATDNFNTNNIIGEGGFGCVFYGILDDGSKVAVKALTKENQQRSKEFIAEVEMLSRLHHRNLVKLIGICTEEYNRCLVYELVPNGSVESHLHGLDKVTAPLDWDARMKIALGAARGLAYLHEDSNPRVIHRDFKASNILLESDFTPKISDFGLAKAAPDEGRGHISTRVMGTFGYVAPEYAMTGHLLVKSDVYSYGVVLLELLSGKKPVDMSHPPGQENLVTWARPFLSSMEGLEMLVDPALDKRFSFDNLARVAAIASMCVQPEVSHRPFMGEVVQALKLVCNDSDDSNGVSSVTVSPPSQNSGGRDGHPWVGPGSLHTDDKTSFLSIDYDSGTIHTTDLETGLPPSVSTLLSDSGDFIRQLSDSFRRHSTSGPLSSTGTNSTWNIERDAFGGSMSEHGLTKHLSSDFNRNLCENWP